MLRGEIDTTITNKFVNSVWQMNQLGNKMQGDIILRKIVNYVFKKSIVTHFVSVIQCKYKTKFLVLFF